MRIIQTATPLILSAALAACSAMTTLSARQPETKVTIVKSTGTAVPRSESFSTTSFGNYEFVAEAPGQEPFYGILPLKFNGGYLALDILLFTPAMFFNLREVYSYYEFDLEKKQVLYKQHPNEEWNVFVPLKADEEQGRAALAKAQ